MLPRSAPGLLATKDFVPLVLLVYGARQDFGGKGFSLTSVSSISGAWNARVCFLLPRSFLHYCVWYVWCAERTTILCQEGFVHQCEFRIGIVSKLPQAFRLPAKAHLSCCSFVYISIVIHLQTIDFHFHYHVSKQTLE